MELTFDQAAELLDEMAEQFPPVFFDELNGGILLEEVWPETMGSRLQPGLYFAGELLDAAGSCGGFNLHWAWGTGIRAGRSAALGK